MVRVLFMLRFLVFVVFLEGVREEFILFGFWRFDRLDGER